MSKKHIESDPEAAIDAHIRKFFSGHQISAEFWDKGPITQALPDFKVLRVDPGPVLDLWTYVSVGSWSLFDDSRLEFVILSADERRSYVERLAMTAYYHSLHQLGLGHTFPVGEPWVENSKCDYCLVALPYPLGDRFETCNIDNGHVHFCWLLPITETERQYKIDNGLEALEVKFEEHALEFWNNEREAVV